MEWFENHGVKYTDIVFECNNKALYGKLNHFDMIVDDTLKNCTDCEKVGITPIWIRTKYNSAMSVPQGMLYTSSWEMVDRMVQTKIVEKNADTPTEYVSNKSRYGVQNISEPKMVAGVAMAAGDIDSVM